MNIAQIRALLCDCNLDDGHHISPVVALCNAVKAAQDLASYNTDQKQALAHAAQCVIQHGFHGLRTQAESLLHKLGEEL